MTQPRDETSMQDIISAATLAMQFIDGLDQKSFEADLKTQSAVMRQLEIVGEAANRVSRQTQSKFAEIPWNKLISMRNRLIHGYDDVEMAIVWQTVTVELAKLITSLNKILPDFDYNDN